MCLSFIFFSEVLQMFTYSSLLVLFIIILFLHAIVKNFFSVIISEIETRNIVAFMEETKWPADVK